eukprot:CAMPEP_0180658346 /NCGR_PEP_ID=MMETSP1037_2-20121125/56953_1 /TAXON_ID=632150 /ORGANISM="Azadinium spinosum, Strain 3D9" /LENGTH=58 /DNA_ID=CAMNT_0022685223 /DNA_START=99 /DNA_END=272 /DNA_ORIENTATION=-
MSPDTSSPAEIVFIAKHWDDDADITNDTSIAEDKNTANVVATARESTYRSEAICGHLF